MSRGNDLSTFLVHCNKLYDSEMEEYVETCDNLLELQEKHRKVRGDLVTRIAEHWRDANQNIMVSHDAESQLQQELDKAFEILKKVFTRCRERDKSKHQTENALDKYTTEMEKFFAENPSASYDELESKHDTVLKCVVPPVKHMDSKSAPISIAILNTINLRYAKYQQRVEMNEQFLRDPAIGIDLGTTTCCVALYRNGKIEIIPNRDQNSSATTPSYVSYRQDGTVTYGSIAKQQAPRYPDTTIFDAKRMIGRQWDDHYLQENMKRWPFVVVNDNDNPKVVTSQKVRYPQEVSAHLLTKLRGVADAYLGNGRGPVRKAVITVPAYFNEPQRRATIEAAECAGFEVLNIVNEPTAAALAYCWDEFGVNDRVRSALIYDLGGGTFDVTIATISGTKVDVLAVNGDTHLGGRDFDQAMMNYCVKEFKSKENIDLFQLQESESTTEKYSAKQALARLRMQCEQVKEGLSTTMALTVEVDQIWNKANLEVVVKRDVFEAMIRPLVEKTLNVVTEALNDVSLKGISGKEEIDDVIMVGGATRVPLVQKMVREYFGGKDLCKRINPDQAVAYGAAIDAALCNSAVSLSKHVTVKDVTPYSLGVFVLGDKFSILIPKNSSIPIEETGSYCTSVDNQTEILVRVYQGEDPVCSKNEKIGSFTLLGFEPKPKGEEKCTIAMKLNENGTLIVSAESIHSSNSIEISAQRLGMDNASFRRVMAECAEALENL